jgi:hypothetical protein
LLPFLKPKNQGVAGLVVKMRKPDEKAEGGEISEESDDKDAAIHACAQDLIKAVHSHDVKGAAEAIRSAFEILESMPHEEGEHVEPHSYEAQNIEAGE